MLMLVGNFTSTLTLMKAVDYLELDVLFNQALLGVKSKSLFMLYDNKYTTNYIFYSESQIFDRLSGWIFGYALQDRLVVPREDLGCIMRLMTQLQQRKS